MSSTITKLTGIVVLGMCFLTGYAQSGMVAAGGDAQSNNGSVAYSIGQVFYTSPDGAGGKVFEGLQQPYEISTVGISVVDLDFALTVYPNPTFSSLTLEILPYKGESLDYFLFDMHGRLLSSKGISESQTRIETTSLVPGTYYLTVSTEQQQIQSFKIIKNN